MFEKILDKIDDLNSRAYDWQRTSTSRSVIVFWLNTMLVIPFAFAFVGVVAAIGAFFFWAIGALLGI